MIEAAQRADQLLDEGDITGAEVPDVILRGFRARDAGLARPATIRLFQGHTRVTELAKNTPARVKVPQFPGADIAAQ
jgi:hypothetical protein